MENLDSLAKTLMELDARRAELTATFDMAKLQQEENELRLQMEAADFWQDQIRAIKISRRAELLHKDISRWQELASAFQEGKELLELSKSDEDEALIPELSQKIERWQEDLESLETTALYSGPHDDKDVILSIKTGTGGVDAQDWTQMLERMYLRLAERQEWKVEILDRLAATEAGIKSVMMRISGIRPYGNLKSENGTHRLLRNSPFNADGLRQTSFSSVEVIPELPEIDINIKDEDVRLDVFRSSGPGGQSVNTTDSAVRLVHIPSGITISCQSERSQHQNKENAYTILRARLVQLELKKKEEAENKLKGGIIKAEWGQQIRSYWFYGNRLVKDHRSEYSDSDVDGVMDGKLEKFIAAYLRYLRQSE
ncbi:MAG: peptide chain release factor 2 [Patescibacteria group bacterium]|nr:peptide chain release factor 2 [Patescibacteria group bacterium]